MRQGRLHDREILFLARHGAGHRLLPHEVNYRANVFALKRAGATQILGFSAVGSLVEAVAPGDLAMPSQYFDWTRGARERSFFGGGVAAHISTAIPVSENLVTWAAGAAKRLDITLHTGLTYACVEGPRLGTRAESHFMRGAGCHLVGMTNVPEAFLAREAQICYATVGIVTDYDCWMDDPSQARERECAARALWREPGQGPPAARCAAGDAARARRARDPQRAAKRADDAGNRIDRAAARLARGAAALRARSQAPR